MRIELSNMQYSVPSGVCTSMCVQPVHAKQLQPLQAFSFVTCLSTEPFVECTSAVLFRYSNTTCTILKSRTQARKHARTHVRTHTCANCPVREIASRHRVKAG